MFEFGIDRIEGDPGQRRYLYYIEPSEGAFLIPNPATVWRAVCPIVHFRM